MIETNRIYNMDCIEGMKLIEDNSVDAIVTDPPYGLGFMGKEWDTFDRSQFGTAGTEGPNDLKIIKNFNILPRYNTDGLYEFTKSWSIECLRILKPGGYLLSFAGTRTQHKIASAIEDAGFEIRDIISWVYGSGFPKSLNIGKAVDKLQGNEREEYLRLDGKHSDSGSGCYNMNSGHGSMKKEFLDSKGTSEWEGWGTALKPSFEPITVARKPLECKTVAENVLKYGTGGINIDECRVGTEGARFNGRNVDSNIYGKYGTDKPKEVYDYGRFPANFIHDGSDEVLELFTDTTGQGHWPKTKVTGFGDFGGGKSEYFGVGEKDKLGGSAARFFYCAKASSSERNNGCDKLEDKKWKLNNLNGGDRLSLQGSVEGVSKNNHPTVKPVELMTYLIKLVSRENSIIVDPFTGSGTTLIAAKHLKRIFIGFEKEKEYYEIANERLKYNYSSDEREKVGFPSRTKGFF